MVDAHGVTDVRAADGAAVVARLKHLAALVAGDHVVAGVEQTVAHVGHADGAVPVHVGRQDGCKSPKSHAGIDHPHALDADGSATATCVYLHLWHHYSQVLFPNPQQTESYRVNLQSLRVLENPKSQKAINIPQAPTQKAQQQQPASIYICGTS